MLYSSPSKGIYEYPPVEYIPLYPRNLAKVSLPATREGSTPDLLIADSTEVWQELAQRYRLTAEVPLPLDFRTDFVVVLLHCAPVECKYRDRRVTIVVAPEPGLVQAFSLTKRLFYRSDLELILYQTDGKQLSKIRRHF